MANYTGGTFLQQASNPPGGRGNLKAEKGTPHDANDPGGMGSVGFMGASCWSYAHAGFVRLCQALPWLIVYVDSMMAL